MGTSYIFSRPFLGTVAYPLAAGSFESMSMPMVFVLRANFGGGVCPHSGNFKSSEGGASLSELNRGSTRKNW